MQLTDDERAMLDGEQGEDGAGEADTPAGAQEIPREQYLEDIRELKANRTRWALLVTLCYLALYGGLLVAWPGFAIGALVGNLAYGWCGLVPLLAGAFAIVFARRNSIRAATALEQYATTRAPDDPSWHPVVPRELRRKVARLKLEQLRITRHKAKIASSSAGLLFLAAFGPTMGLAALALLWISYGVLLCISGFALCYAAFYFDAPMRKRIKALEQREREIKEEYHQALREAAWLVSQAEQTTYLVNPDLQDAPSLNVRANKLLVQHQQESAADLPASEAPALHRATPSTPISLPATPCAVQNPHRVRLSKYAAICGLLCFIIVIFVICSSNNHGLAIMRYIAIGLGLALFAASLWLRQRAAAQPKLWIFPPPVPLATDQPEAVISGTGAVTDVVSNSPRAADNAPPPESSLGSTVAPAAGLDRHTWLQAEWRQQERLVQGNAFGAMFFTYPTTAFALVCLLAQIAASNPLPPALIYTSYKLWPLPFLLGVRMWTGQAQLTRRLNTLQAELEPDPLKRECIILHNEFAGLQRSLKSRLRLLWLCCALYYAMAALAAPQWLGLAPERGEGLFAGFCVALALPLVIGSAAWPMRQLRRQAAVSRELLRESLTRLHEREFNATLPELSGFTLLEEHTGYNVEYAITHSLAANRAGFIAHELRWLLPRDRLELGLDILRSLLFTLSWAAAVASFALPPQADPAHLMPLLRQVAYTCLGLSAVAWALGLWRLRIVNAQ